MYCPCCREEFDDGEEYCMDCCLPLIDEIPSQSFHLCECDTDGPRGIRLANKVKDDLMDVAAEVFELIGKGGNELDEYIEKILKFNH